MFKACVYCGKIHSLGVKCSARPKYKRADSIIRRVHNKKKGVKLANIVREDSNGICTVCFDNGVINNRDLEVHHIEKIRERIDLAFDEENLICLCRTHHQLAEVGMINKDYLRDLVKQRMEKTPPSKKINNFCANLK